MSEESKLPEPVTRGDMYLNVILNGNKDGDELPAPLTRIEMYLKALLDKLESGSLELPEGGKEGQILALGADGSLAWIDAPSIDGNYLPLAGGKMDDNASITGTSLRLGSGTEGGEMYIGFAKGKIDTWLRIRSRNVQVGSIEIDSRGVDLGSKQTDDDDYATRKGYVDSVAVPTGGTVGQVLAKKSATDRDCEWVTPSSGASNTVVFELDHLYGSMSLGIGAPWERIVGAALMKPTYAEVLFSLDGDDAPVPSLSYVSTGDSMDITLRAIKSSGPVTVGTLHISSIGQVTYTATDDSLSPKNVLLRVITPDYPVEF